MLYNIKYKEGLILFIKKEIRKHFAKISMILDNRGIILMTETIEENINKIKEIKQTKINVKDISYSSANNHRLLQ
jgi:hypothetical protein